MVNRSKSLGTAAETAVVNYLRGNGFPTAERRTLKGALDQGDVTGTPGICWEVKGGAAAKNASDSQVAAWLDETEVERVNSRADVGVLVLARAGVGPANAGRWWAVLRHRLWHELELHCFTRVHEPIPYRLHLADAVTLLRATGYGEPPRKASHV